MRRALQLIKKQFEIARWFDGQQRYESYSKSTDNFLHYMMDNDVHSKKHSSVFCKYGQAEIFKSICVIHMKIQTKFCPLLMKWGNQQF